ncbi:hypothetical protein BRD00_07475 [Halobacteriales archaeon QS_8_69_26]|nr:MAG: hypothetical protein BRD00_07475 [Halobacteriales archaeon QS_8_69_26]
MADDSATHRATSRSFDRRTALKSIGVAATLGTAGCLGGGGGGGDGDGNTLRIGQTLGLSGPVASLDEQNQKGVKTGLAYARDNGFNLQGDDAEIEHITYDNEGDPEKARQQARRLVDQDDVHVLLTGTGSTYGSAVAPVAHDEEVPFIPYSSYTPTIAELNSEWVFVPAPRITQYGKGFLELMALQSNPPQKVGVLKENTVVGEEMAPAMVEYADDRGFDFDVSIIDTYDRGKDMTSSLQKAQNANVDALANAGHYKGDVAVARGTIQQGMDLKAKMAGVSISLDVFLKDVKDAANGMVGYTGFHPGAKTPLSDELVGRYEQDNAVPGWHDGAGFTQTLLATETAKEAGSLDKQDIIDTLHDGIWPTPMGTLDFDMAGKPSGLNHLTVQVQGGDRELVYPIDQRTADDFIYPLSS